MKIMEVAKDYLFGRDISEYYNRQRTFYEEFITDEERAERKKRYLKGRERDMRIAATYYPAALDAIGIAVSLLMDNPCFLSVAVAGEAARLGSRIMFRIGEMEYDSVFRETAVMMQSFKDDLSEWKREGYDVSKIERASDDVIEC